jgi:serine/threonine protein kinase
MHTYSKTVKWSGAAAMFITLQNRFYAQMNDSTKVTEATLKSQQRVKEMANNNTTPARTIVPNLSALLRHATSQLLSSKQAMCAPGLFYGGSRKRMREKKNINDFNVLSQLHPTYTVGRVVGTGGFGSVRHGHDTRTGKPVALKFLPKNETSRRELDVEVKLQRAVHSFVGVNKILDVVQTPKEWVVVMEYLSGGELFDKLIASGAYSEREASKVLRAVCSTIAHLHHRGIVHGDIKPENIMLKDENADADLELIDFGMAFRLNHDGSNGSDISSSTSSFSNEHNNVTPEILLPSNYQENEKEKEKEVNKQSNNRLPIDLLIRKREKKRQRRMTNAHRLGTTAYAPPEVLQAKPVGEGVDMWALGVIMFILLSGTHPFDLANDASDDEIEDNIIGSKLRFDDQVWEDVSPSAIELVRLLLSPDPHDRPSAEEALEHPWLAEDAYDRLGAEPMTEAAENLLKYQRGRTYLRASVLAVLLGIADAPLSTTRGSWPDERLKAANTKNDDSGLSDTATSVHVDPYQSSNMTDNMLNLDEQPLVSSDGNGSANDAVVSERDDSRVEKVDSPVLTADRSRHRGGAYASIDTDGAPISFAAITRSSTALESTDPDDTEAQVYGRLRRFDRDNKGFISHNDLRLVTSELGVKLTDQELSDMAKVATGKKEKNIDALQQNNSINNELYTNTSGSVSIVFDNDINTNNTTNETDASNDTNPNGSDGNNNRFDNKRSSVDDSTNLAHRDIQRVLTSLRTQRFNKGDLITREGEVERIFHLLVSGKVRMTVTNSQGKEVTVNDVMPGEHFGAWELMHSDGKAKPRRKTGRCFTNSCEVLTLPQSDFKVLTETFGNVRERMHNQLRLRTRDMLRHYLKEEVADYKEEVYEAGQLVYSQGEVCDSLFLVLEGEVDVTRETVVEDDDDSSDEKNNVGAQHNNEEKKKKKTHHIVVEQLGAGDFFPLGVLGISTFRKSTRGASVRARVHTRVARVNGEEFRTFQDKHRTSGGTEKHVVDDLHEDVIERHEKRAKRAGIDSKLDEK